MNDGIWKYFKSIGKTKAQIYFLNKCKQFQLIPNGFKSKPLFNSLKSNQLELRFAKIRLNERLYQLHAKLFMADLHVTTKLQLHPLPEDIMQDLNETTQASYSASQQILCHKFHKLLHRSRQQPHPPPMQFKTDAVLNLSSRNLSQDELRILSLGFNFRPSLPSFPTDSYILATESYIKSSNLPPEESALLRNAVINELNKIQSNIKYNPPRSNLSRSDWKTIHSLKSDHSIIIIPADKGNKTVILDRQTYLDKLQERVQQHRKIDSDPTLQREHKLNLALRTIQENQTNPQQTKPTLSTPLILARSTLVKLYSSRFSSSAWLHGFKST